MSTKLSIAELNAVVAAYVAANKIAQSSFTATYNNTADLFDQIAKTFILDGMFADKLPELDGDELPLAKTLQEYYANLIEPTDYDDSGASDAAPADLTYMAPCYSYNLGRKKFKDTKRYEDLQVAFTNEQEYIAAIDLITKRLWDSYALYKYTCKKELLAKYAQAAEEAVASTTTFAASTNYKAGVYLRSASSGTIKHGVVVKEIPASQTPALTWATAVSGGYIVVLDLVSNIAIPTDTATGEEFIKAVKTYVRKSKFVTEGNSLAGNTLGASEGMLLIINTSVIPSLEVDTWAGAFHKEDAMFDVNVKEVDDFGSDSTGVYAMLIDVRACKMHLGYQAVRTRENADGDFINFVLHTMSTAAYSKFTFLHVFRAA